MIHAEEKLLFREVHHQRDEVLAPPLDLEMVAFAKIVNTDVNFRPARHAAGHFFADEKVRIMPQLFRGVDRVMVGQGDDGHAHLLAAGVDLAWLVVGLLTNTLEQRSVAHS